IGTRAEFYEATGAFRDMIVTHLLQVLGFVAMEPPAGFDSEALVHETTSVFDALRTFGPDDVVRGPYDGYPHRPAVAPGSTTETFVALCAFIDNERWDGVPFYLRTGKCMAQGRRVVTIVAKDRTHELLELKNGYRARELVFDLGEPGSISTHFLVKSP